MFGYLCTRLGNDLRAHENYTTLLSVSDREAGREMRPASSPAVRQCSQTTGVGVCECRNDRNHANRETVVGAQSQDQGSVQQVSGSTVRHRTAAYTQSHQRSPRYAAAEFFHHHLHLQVDSHRFSGVRGGATVLKVGVQFREWSERKKSFRTTTFCTSRGHET